MTPQRVLAWVLYGIWVAWMFALQSWLGRDAGASWVPDVGLVLALSLLSRAEVSDAPLIALITAIARAGFGPEPSIVLLTGAFGVVFLALVARSAVELSGILWRSLAALVFVLGFDGWLAFATAMRANQVDTLHLGAAFSAWPAAISSALLALAFGPALAHLPGLTPIRRRRW